MFIVILKLSHQSSSTVKQSVAMWDCQTSQLMPLFQWSSEAGNSEAQPRILESLVHGINSISDNILICIQMFYTCIIFHNNMGKTDVCPWWFQGNPRQIHSFRLRKIFSWVSDINFQLNRKASLCNRIFNHTYLCEFKFNKCKSSVFLWNRKVTVRSEMISVRQNRMKVWCRFRLQLGNSMLMSTLGWIFQMMQSFKKLGHH